ncbi:MAG TPA: helix-turn-helix domain-containing protein [Thermomicrobiales bacterium]|nr:helix-turn-helix domain-containing protein [Thermomicrobiales bacterium]
MRGDVDVAAVAELVADSTRATMLAALTDGRALTAGELARRARVAPSTASGHLARLIAGGALTVERQGRHHYYRIADAGMIQVLQALAVLATVAPPRTLRESDTLADVRRARACYTHLAGAIGVALADALVAGGILSEVADGYAVTDTGAERFAAFGLDLAPDAKRRVQFAPHHIDWSERRHHVAGALGAALFRRMLDLGWLRQVKGSRAVRLTEAGKDGLRDWFGMDASAW